MSERVYVVRADWDVEARVWVAYSDDVPGLATGADTPEDLVDEAQDGGTGVARGYSMPPANAAASSRRFATYPSSCWRTRIEIAPPRSTITDRVSDN